jgi:endonuclease/exonuclease/phosphatase (EEP) superfamily protein YafD
MRWFNGNTLRDRIINFIPYFLFLGIIGITLLSLISSFGENMFFELFSHFKIQYFILISLLFGLLLLTRSKKIFIISSLACLSVIATEIVPWHIPNSPISINTAANLRILSTNINIQNKNYPKVLSLIRKEKPDIAVIIETDDAWIKQLNSLSDILPYSIYDENLYNFFGIAVYSKIPLNNASINVFGVPKNPSILANITINRQVVSLIATHPPPPKPNLFKSRNKQLDEISQYAKSLSNPVVIVGDFNITMWSQYYKRFVSNTGLKNARQGFGILPTWPKKTIYRPYSRIPSFLLWLLSIPIDHCLVSPEIKVANIRTAANVASDHLPIVIDLVIPEKKG